MNEIDPAFRFNADAVKAHDGDKPDAKRRAELNAIAEQVASQYRHDSMSPIMVSGTLRLVEFGILVITGLVIYLVYVGINHTLMWEYPAAILGAIGCHGDRTGAGRRLSDWSFAKAVEPIAAHPVFVERHLCDADPHWLLSQDICRFLAFLARQLVCHRLSVTHAAAVILAGSFVTGREMAR